MPYWIFHFFFSRYISFRLVSIGFVSFCLILFRFCFGFIRYNSFRYISFQGRFQSMEWHLFGDFLTQFIVTVQPIWDRKYRAWTCSVVEILGLDSILDFGFDLPFLSNISLALMKNCSLAYFIILLTLFRWVLYLRRRPNGTKLIIW
jgi:hypothetical protein